MMRIPRRSWLAMMAAGLVAACRNAPEPARPPTPETVTLTVEGMT